MISSARRVPSAPLRAASIIVSARRSVAWFSSVVALADGVAILPVAGLPQRGDGAPRWRAARPRSTSAAALAQRALDVGEHGVGLVARLDEQPRLHVGLGVGERVLDHPLDVGLG